MTANHTPGGAESVREQLEQDVGKALLRNAIFRMESALMVGGTLLATVFLPNVIPWIPWFVWPIVGVIGEVAIIVSTLTDKAEQQKAVEALFREKYSFAGIHDRALLSKLNEAEQYRKRIQAVADQHRAGLLRDRMKRTTDQVYDWIANMVALARRLDTYRSDRLLRRDLENVPREVERLKARLQAERDPRVRDQMSETLESNREQAASLSELRSRMDRADLQLDHSLAALGTVYSQLLLIGTKDVDSDRAERLRDDIQGEVLALKDIVDSLNEVYTSTSTELSSEEAEAARQLQKAERAG
jgi:adenylate kinase family enzyme